MAAPLYHTSQATAADTLSEAFIVCRNFDSSKVPLPITFSPEALESLAQQTTGTLTLESLADLVSESQVSSKEWDAIKAYVGKGDLE